MQSTTLILTTKNKETKTLPTLVKDKQSNLPLLREQSPGLVCH